MKSTQFILFRLEEELYAAEITGIREIILFDEPTKVPDNPAFIEGVINYRGAVVPILDLKKRFHLGSSGITRDTRLIISDINDGFAGFLVDEIVEILRIDSDAVNEAPPMTKIAKEYITGVVKHGEKLIVLLNLSRVLTVDEQEILSKRVLN